jgi:murein DD-endopeptidase MepM/ murein hydrolase activator NlpD
MKYLLILTILIFLGCSYRNPPKEKLYQYELKNRYEFNGDELKVELVNTLKCPMRIWVQSSDDKIKTHFDRINPFTLGPLEDTLIKVKLKNVKIKEVHFASRFGDTSEVVVNRKVELPFQKGKSYSLIQGNNSSPTHDTDESRYAFDFGLAVGDTICAATNGFVVGVIEDYKFGGRQEKWRDFANVITVYNPETGMFTQYVHLDYKGSLVKLGDSIWKGQKIGISGMTGFTNIEHLHFDCHKPIHSQHGLISVEIDSIGSYKVSDLKRNQIIKNEPYK